MLAIANTSFSLHFSHNRVGSPILPSYRNSIGSTNSQQTLHARRVLRPRTEPRSYVESPDVVINGNYEKPQTNGSVDYSSDSSEGEMPPFSPIKELSPAELQQR